MKISRKAMASLSSSLILNKFILSLFGVTDFTALSADLKDVSLEGYDEENISLFYHRLVSKFYGNKELPKELLLRYDQNIYSNTSRINTARPETIRWKYFQYLTLLFTEIYLDRYFNDAQGLLKSVNAFMHASRTKDPQAFKGIGDFRLDHDANDLNKLAFWNATGSGKTLLLHMAILQYQHYLAKHSKARSLNRIIVLTPNEGLSRQHLAEFSASGMEAELFDKNAGSLFRGTRIEIIDIHKLEEKSGDKTVAVESFEGNNLVLVDEGHRGSSGETWKDKRNRLCEQGFSFEYSATFGQAVSAATGAKQKALISEYGKATLFDYSYRYFYNDGYGKDYQILNLNQNWDQNYTSLYLTACLLSFYEQLLVFREERAAIEPFLIAKPLAIFVGGKVTKTISKDLASDVVEVLKFFAGFIRNREESIDHLHRILLDRAGLNDNAGHSIFRNAFREIRKQGREAAQVYEDVLKEVFNCTVAGALLHIDNLKGQDGEIGLRIGNADYFGVINVGDDAGLIKLCEEQGLSTEDKDFSSSLFRGINRLDSSINVLIGSKKFSEGWSSWRVSTMGLLNIGRGEGAEIIQLFGRGVRLKGYKYTLKRSSALDWSIKPDYIPPALPILETLNIFGLRADYMQQFRSYLEEEGLPADSDYEKVTLDILPVIKLLSEKKLKYVRVREGSNFKKDEVITIQPHDNLHVILDWYPKVQMLQSSRNTISSVTNVEEGKLHSEHLEYLSWTDIYFELQQFKNERSWYNINLRMEQLKSILTQSNWYTLYIPTTQLEFNNYGQVRVWQEIAVALLKAFIERLYNYQKQKYYSARLETAILDTTHPNFEEEYRVMVKKSEDRIIQKLLELKALINKKELSESFQIGQDFEAMYFMQHLYYPLLTINQSKYKDTIKVQPVPLNKGEREFVNDLRSFYESRPEFFKSKCLYLLRNMSRKGIGFFEANNFYPDFILWLVEGNRQYVSFIDPKGLRQVQGFDDFKVQLHRKIRSTIQRELGDPDVYLNSFIISNTPYGQLSHWRGQEHLEDFNNQHIFFQQEQKHNYIEKMLAKSITT